MAKGVDGPASLGDNACTDAGGSERAHTGPEERLTWQVPGQPAVALNHLVQHGKVVSVGFVVHHPPSGHNLQLPLLHQPAGTAPSHGHMTVT